MSGCSYNDAPEAAYVPDDRQWYRWRFQRYRLGRGDFREDTIGLPGTGPARAAPPNLAPGHRWADETAAY